MREHFAGEENYARFKTKLKGRLEGGLSEKEREKIFEEEVERMVGEERDSRERKKQDKEERKKLKTECKAKEAEARLRELYEEAFKNKIVRGANGRWTGTTAAAN